MSERSRELRRRRKRAEKMAHYRRRLTKANATEKAAIAGKIRKITTGANDALRSLGLQE